jgi:hypothetical protein
LLGGLAEVWRARRFRGHVKWGEEAGEGTRMCFVPGWRR